MTEDFQSGAVVRMGQPCHQRSCLLQGLDEGCELGPGKDGDRLLQGIDLRSSRLLTRIEILHSVITRRMKVGELACKTSKSILCALELALRFYLLLLGLPANSDLVSEIQVQCIELHVGVRHKLLVVRLSLDLSTSALFLHGLGLIDDPLDHAHHAARLLVLLVSLEASRRWRAHGLLGLHEGRLVIETLKGVEGCCQDLLSGPLLRYHSLELRVGLFAIFA